MWCCVIILSQICDRECTRYVQVEVYKSRKLNAFKLKCSTRNFMRPKRSTVWSYRTRISFMGRSPCSSKFEGLRRGAWTANEDMALCEYIRIHGEGGWTNLPQKAGLMRTGKSCRLRWLNYLRPDIKRGNISPDEEELIIRLHRLLGNRWSLIAGRLPGRTDNEIKNYWNTYPQLLLP